MNFNNCCYTLKGLCSCQKAHLDVITKSQIEWEPVPITTDMHLELGKKMGRLCIMNYFSEDWIQRSDFFFANNENDHVLRCMDPVCSQSKDEICIILPFGQVGLFILNTDMEDEWWHANDSYVLKVAAMDNDHAPNENTLQLFFFTLYNQIKLRTAWKNLYFRCFRKAFHPECSQAKRLVEAWGNL